MIDARLQPVAAPLSLGGLGGQALHNIVGMVERRRIWAIGTIAAALIAGLLLSFLTPKTYQAAAILEISREVVEVFDGESKQRGPTTIDQEFYETQFGLLRGRALARDVVRSLRLADNPDFVGEDEAEDAATPAQRREARERRAIEKVEENTQIVPSRQSRLVEIRYTDRDPELAARISNSLVENYIRSNLTRRIDRTAYARNFLEQRIEETRRKLEDTERALVAYAGNQGIISVPSTSTAPDGAAGTASQSLAGNNLAAMSNALSAARVARIEAEARLRSSRGAQGRNRAEVLENPAVNTLIQQRAEYASEAAQLTTNFKSDYPPLVAARSQVEQIDEQLSQLTGRLLGSLLAEYNTALQRERELAQQVDTLKSNLFELSRRSIQYNILQRDVDTNRSLYEGLLQRYKEVSVANDIGSNNVAFVLRAEVPHEPAAPQPFQILLTALLIGLIAALLVVVVVDTLDTSIASPDEIKDRFDVPVLGVVPKSTHTDPIEGLAHMRSAFTESYLSILTNLKFSTSEGAPRLLSVTSTRASEGKTTTSIALAQLFARQGDKVLLVDADLRKPSIHRRLDLNNAKGLSDLLTGGGDLNSLVQPSGSGAFSVLPSGPLPPSPADVLSGTRLRDVLHQGLASFDRIIVDAPPVLGLADSPLIASAVDATLYIIESGGTRSTSINRALQRIRETEGRVIGVVLTKFSLRRSSADSYGAYEYYGYGEKAHQEHA